MTITDNLEDPGTDPIFGIQTEYQQDLRPFKIDLTVGVYVGESEKKPSIFHSVKEAEKELIETETTKSYLSIAGDRVFLEKTAHLIFGECDLSKMAMVQTVGGTSALHLGWEFLKKRGFSTVSVSNPTWDNHLQILNALGYTPLSYPQLEGAFDFSLITNHLKSLPKKTVVLLQAKSHNPTGVDFTKKQWEELSTILKERDLFPFIDSAYQGFAHSIDEDAWLIRLLLKEKHEFFVAHSYSKSFGLYNERVGAFYGIFQNADQAKLVQSNLNRLVRVNYSNPPSHGSSVIKTILSNPKLKTSWIDELSGQRDRMNAIRNKLADALAPIFDENVILTIKKGHGFFCQLPLKRDEIYQLKKEYAIYMTQSGRISLPGLKESSFDYVLDSIRKVKGL